MVTRPIGFVNTTGNCHWPGPTVKKKRQWSGRGGIRGRKHFAHLGSEGRMGIQGRTNQLNQHYVPKYRPAFTGFGGPRNRKQNVFGSCFFGNVPKVPVEKTTNMRTRPFNQDGCFKNILVQYFSNHNLGSVYFQVFAVGDLWKANVRVNSMEFVHMEPVGGEAEVVEAVSKLCVNKVNILKEDAEMESSEDWATTVKRIGQLLEGKSGGVYHNCFELCYSTIIDKQYEKKSRKQLPSSWWERIEVVRAEPFNVGSGIMIIFPEASLDKSQTNNSDGIKSQTEDDSNKRLQQAQAQVDEVIDILEVNVEMILERNKLSGAGPEGLQSSGGS